MSEQKKNSTGDFFAEDRFEMTSFDSDSEQASPEKGNSGYNTGIDSKSTSFESFQSAPDTSQTQLQDIHFIQDHSVVSSVEDYALRVRGDAEAYAKKMRTEADEYHKQKKQSIVKEAIEWETRKTNLENDLKDIKEEYDKNYNKIYQLAHKEGYGDGKAEALEKAGENIDSVSQIARQMDDLHRKILRKYENEILNLAMIIASKVMMHEIEADPAFLAENLKQIVNSLKDKGRIKLSMSPVDYEFMRRHSDFLADKIDNEESFFTVELDERLKLGKVNIETDFFYFETDLVTRFESIRKDLYKAYFDRIAREQQGMNQKD